MANFNLTTQQIKDTYEQLTQVSASLLVDGTGSLSPIVTSSIINFPTEVSRSAAAAGFGNTAGLVTEATFTAYTASNNSKVNSLTSATSSYALKTDISGAFTSTSASLAADIATNKSDITTKLDTSTFTSYSSSVSTRLTTDEGNISTNASNISTQTSRVDSLVAATSSYAVKSANNTFSGTQNFLNIAVSGTASIGHVQTITGSAVIIGEEFIILNADSPTARYAGLIVFDSGSGTPATASFEWDGLADNWIIQEETGNTGVVITGITGSRGSEVLPTVNRIQKGMGHHSIGDSNITDDGSQVSITGPVSASTYFGDGSNLTGISNGLVLGHGVNSLQSALTTTPALANANGSISIGNSSFTNSTSSIAIGVNSQIGTNANGAINIGSGSISTNCNASIAIGQGSNVAGNRSNVVAIGVNASAGQEGVAIGSGASGVLVSGNDGQTVAIGKNATADGRFAIAIGNGAIASDVNGINIGNVFKFNGTSAISLIGEVSSSLGFIGNGSGLTNVTSVSASYAQTASSADVFNIRTSLTLDSLVPTFVSSGSSTGSLIDNIHPAIASSSAQIKHIVTLTQDQYDASVVFDDTLYVITDISGSTIFVNNLTISGSLIATQITASAGFNGNLNGNATTATSASFATSASIATFATTAGSATTATSASFATTSSFAAGNFQVDGQMFSPVFSGSIASYTSSIDFNEGNFAVLTLTSATHIANPSNIKSGTTYTLVINSGSLAATYGTSFKFAGGTPPTLSNGVDIVTMVSDGNSLFATGLADFQ